MSEFTRADYEALSKKLADDGKLIAAGFLAMRLAVIPPGAPQAQVDDMEAAFMAGAQHLWASIIAMLDPEADPTLGDMKRMQLIDQELRAYASVLERRIHGEKH